MGSSACHDLPGGRMTYRYLPPSSSLPCPAACEQDADPDDELDGAAQVSGTGPGHHACIAGAGCCSSTTAIPASRGSGSSAQAGKNLLHLTLPAVLGFGETEAAASAERHRQRDHRGTVPGVCARPRCTKPAPAAPRDTFRPVTYRDLRPGGLGRVRGVRTSRARIWGGFSQGLAIACHAPALRGCVGHPSTGPRPLSTKRGIRIGSV